MRQQVIPTLAGLIILGALGWYIDQVAHDEIVKAIRFLTFAVAITIVVLVSAITLLFVLSVRERVLTRQAQRRMAQREADVFYLTVGEGQQLFIRDLNKEAVWRNATIDARVIANGHDRDPSQHEMQAWQMYHQLRSRPSILRQVDPLLLAEPAPQLDLLAALDSVQRCLIVGPSDSGKTTLLQHLTSRKLNSSKVIILDPHSWPAKYPNGCVVIGTGRNYDEINRALAGLVRLMTKRYDEIGQGLVAEMGHARYSIVIDEWRAIVSNLGRAASEAIKALLTESRKAAFSVYVATHSDRARPLGLEGEYDLKDGFAIVRLSAINGQRQATIDFGDGPQPAFLPGPYVGGQAPVIDLTEEDISLTEATGDQEMTEAEKDQLFSRLVAQGSSRNEAAMKAYGRGYAGNLVERGKRILGEI